ncbi:hypothetical protein F5Y06DRAFT_296636 [Hypoxylon sp. FL0890]|nr:hypothetical protein F5Y06DRAFT_296636 [Hypoxylon sp. FL0890]
MSPLPLAVDHAAASSARAVFGFLAARDDAEDKKCHPQPNIDLCEKPAASSDATSIVVGTLSGALVVLTIGTLLFLHFRRKRRDEREWPKNNQELEDYGFGPAPSTGAPSKPKNTYRQPRVDDETEQNLPPPGRRDSLSSLARSLRGTPDAYRSRPDDTSHDMKPVEPASQL